MTQNRNGGKRQLGLKIFGGKYRMPYFCIKINDYHTCLYDYVLVINDVKYKDLVPL